MYKFEGIDYSKENFKIKNEDEEAFNSFLQKEKNIKDNVNFIISDKFYFFLG